MIDRMRLFDMIYALAGREGRYEMLFGSSFPVAREAFSLSLAGDSFPETWFEVPLLGTPWFDLHAGTFREGLNPNSIFEPKTCGGYPDVFMWFAAQGHDARQLILSWDVGRGAVDAPAVQFLTGSNDASLTCDFLDAAGRGDAADAYRSFSERLPEGWFACYVGVFPQRKTPFLRVECIPSAEQQREYAADPSLLEAHLRQLSLTEFGETMLSRCQVFAEMPFQMEFQFDVTPDGRIGDTVGVSDRFAWPPGAGSWEVFDPNGAAGELMRQVEEWGLADARWRELAKTAFASRVAFGGESALIYCYPTFVKLRWRDGEPLDAKAYLVAGAKW